MTTDDAPTKAAIVAYEDAVRRTQMWQHGVRAALAAARDADPWALPVDLLPEGMRVVCLYQILTGSWACQIGPWKAEFATEEEIGKTPRAAMIAACEAARGG